MATLQETLTRKVGPLPVWAYGAVVVVGAWLWFYFKGGTGGDGGTTPGAGYPDESVSDGGIIDDSGDNSGLVGGGGNGPPGSAIASNQAWYQLASSFLVGFGYDGVTVGNALTKYLIGEKLSTTERALVSQAIARYGLPPEGVPPSDGGQIPTTPGPPGTPVPPRIPPRTPPKNTGPDGGPYGNAPIPIPRPGPGLPTLPVPRR